MNVYYRLTIVFGLLTMGITFVPPRLFNRTAVNLAIKGGTVMQLINNPLLAECATACGARNNCLAFNFATFPNKSRICQLSSSKVQTPKLQLVNSTYFQYFEEDCTRFIPKGILCLNGGKLSFAFNSSCKMMDNCTCLAQFRGSRCEKKCTFQGRNGTDLDGKQYDVGDYKEPDLQRCLDNCTLTPRCLSVMYNGREKKCVMKSESYFTKDPGVFSVTDKTNILYSMNCTKYP